MRGIGLVVLIFGLVASTASLSAGTPDKKRQADKDARVLAASYANCVVRKSPEVARQVVTKMIPTDEIIRNRESLISSTCLAEVYGGLANLARLRLPGDTIYFTLADALFQIDYLNSAPSDFSRVPPLEYAALVIAPDSDRLPKMNRRTRERLAEAAANSSTAHALYAYSECVVRNNPAASHSLLASKVGTNDETNAFGMLQVALAACLTPNTIVSFPRTPLRGGIAVCYYRLSHALAPEIDRSLKVAN